MPASGLPARVLEWRVHRISPHRVYSLAALRLVSIADADICAALPGCRRAWQDSALRTKLHLLPACMHALLPAIQQEQLQS